MPLYTLPAKQTGLESLGQLTGPIRQALMQKMLLGRRREKEEREWGLEKALKQAQTQKLLRPERVKPGEEIKQLQLEYLQALPPEKRQEVINAMVTKPIASITMGKPAAATERTAIAETRASIDALDNLKMLFDNTQTVTGPIVGRIEPTKGLFGRTTDEQEAFMAATSAFKNAIIKEITGAQMSEVEAKRIMKQIPDITDPSARWLAKWEQSKKNLEFLQKRRVEVLRQSGVRAPEGRQVRTIAPKQTGPKDIKIMSTEELQIELQRLKQGKG